MRGRLGSEQTSASRWKHTKQTSVKEDEEEVGEQEGQ